MNLDSNFWKKYFVEYDNLNRLIPYQQTLRSIEEHLGDRAKGTVLDVGSGTGNLSILLSKNGATVTSVDSVQSGLDLHRRKFPSASVINHDITKGFTFGDNTFDAVCVNNVIYTIPDGKVDFLFYEFHRILKPGGKIVIADIKSNFSASAIYLSHLKLSIQQSGLLNTILDVVKLIIPTIKIFYYNTKIKRAYFTKRNNVSTDKDIAALLTKNNFKDIHTGIRVYADQSVLSYATK